VKRLLQRAGDLRKLLENAGLLLWREPVKTLVGLAENFDCVVELLGQTDLKL
jgi:hypothetical protein